jgi:hypothetical protein
LGRLSGLGAWYWVEAAKRGEDREGDTVHLGGEERVEEGELLRELGDWRDCLVGMVLGEELCLSSGCLP